MGGTWRRAYSVAVLVTLAALDNVVIGLLPPLYTPWSAALGVGEAALGVTTAATYLVTAASAVGWGYLGDAWRRRPLLLVGTVGWTLGALGTAAAPSFGAFVAAQLLTALGLGAVSVVGFSVVSDLVSPRRRGLVLALWGLSQGAGLLAGTLLGGLLGARQPRLPFLVLAVVGVVAAAAYLGTREVPRGGAEPELAPLFRDGAGYPYRLRRGDLGVLWARRTNRWLILQGLTAQAALGSFVWLPRLLQSRAQEQGIDTPTAIMVGSVLAALLQLGGVLSVCGGWLGDRVARRRPGGRALVAGVAVLAAVPLYVVLFLLPLRVPVPAGADAGAVLRAVLGGVLTSPTVAAAVLLGLCAAGLTAANSPNWFALIAEVNPPEHRGTVFGLGNLVNGAGRAGGTALAAGVFRAVAAAVPPPASYAVGLAACQLMFVPTGLMFLRAARSSPADIAATAELLRERAAAAR
ncbi:MFS transporter [Pilimelia terevasa]|nr:MFS transporter [Pilimelia terevasa]